MRQLGTVLFAAAAAESLSDLGSVTGFYVDAAGVGFGFLRYRDGTIAVFGVPDSVFLEAVGTNDAGKRALRVSDYVQDNSVSLVVRGEATARASTYSRAVPTGNGGWPLTDGARTLHSRINTPCPFTPPTTPFARRTARLIRFTPVLRGVNHRRSRTCRVRRSGACSREAERAYSPTAPAPTGAGAY